VSDNKPTPYEQIEARSEWYGKQARVNQSRYFGLKFVQIVAAAAIPVIAVGGSGDWQKWSTAVLGALIGIIEGLQQLRQYHQNWLLFRGTREALKREKFLYEAGTGPYAQSQAADKLYFERCDQLISGESNKWTSSQEQLAAQKAASA
jgi:hypothetical protein